MAFSIFVRGILLIAVGLLSGAAMAQPDVPPPSLCQLLGQPCEPEAGIPPPCELRGEPCDDRITVPPVCFLRGETCPPEYSVPPLCQRYGIPCESTVKLPPPEPKPPVATLPSPEPRPPGVTLPPKPEPCPGHRCKPGTVWTPIAAVELAHPDGRFLVTADVMEIEELEAGRWVRTGEEFLVWGAGRGTRGTNASPVCRFDLEETFVFSASPKECALLIKERFEDYEGTAFLVPRVHSPEQGCPPYSTKVHRLTKAGVERVIADSRRVGNLLLQGWAHEEVAFCTAPTAVPL
jgi:hypothetical protein